jgi:hypothetical protein
MTVQEAIDAAELLLPGEAAPDGSDDPRWQSIIAVGEFIEGAPGPVWEFIKRWGVHADDDLRMAIATCLLEHLLESHFEAFFPHVQEQVRANRLFAGTFRNCSKFGQSEALANAERFDALRREASEFAG